jgi:hypothetical protein
MLEKGRSWQSFSMEIGLDQGLQCRKIRPNRPRYQDYAARLEMFQRNSQHLLRLRVRSVSHDIQYESAGLGHLVCLSAEAILTTYM